MGNIGNGLAARVEGRFSVFLGAIGQWYFQVKAPDERTLTRRSHSVEVVAKFRRSKR